MRTRKGQGWQLRRKVERLEIYSTTNPTNMILTREIIHEAGNGVSSSGFNRQQLQLLGIAWPPQRGWLRELIGTEIDEAKWAKVVQLRGINRKAVITDPNGHNPDIEAQVCADILARQQLGIAKYGTTVADSPLPLKQWLQHAYEETLDKAIYLKRAIAECSTSRD
jgi:hypothetical protein